MKIEFVTGKGGVGKSSQAASLALAHAKRGRRTLLAELGDHSFFKDYLQMPVVDEHARASSFGFSVALWSGQSCLREYALHLLKVEKLYKLFFENPVSSALIQAAPALAELAILGKITSGPPRNVGPKMNFDVIVVDGYASGHFAALLKAPQAMSQIISVGPMGTQSRSIVDVLKRPEICRYHIVTLAEELPLREALELRSEIQSLVGSTGRIYVNKWIEDVGRFGSVEKDFAWSDDFLARGDRQRHAEELLGEQVVKIPLIFESEPQKLIETLAPVWSEANPC